MQTRPIVKDDIVRPYAEDAALWVFYIVSDMNTGSIALHWSLHQIEFRFAVCYISSFYEFVIEYLGQIIAFWNLHSLAH